MRRVELILVTLFAAGCYTNSMAQTAFTYSQICKAGIGTVMGRDPETMFAEVDGRSFLLISYRRDGDGELITYKCRIIDDRIHWGNVDGRWRDDPADSALTFYTDGEYLFVQDRFPDGSSILEEFTISQLGPE